MKLINLILSVNLDNVLYKAYGDDLEKIYLSIEQGEYSNVIQLANQIIEDDCLDIRVICYAIFARWFLAESVIEQFNLFKEFQQIIEYIESNGLKININERIYNSAIKWLYNNILKYIKSINIKNTLTEEYKSELLLTINQHMLFMKSCVNDIDVIEVLEKIFSRYEKASIKEDILAEESISRTEQCHDISENGYHKSNNIKENNGTEDYLKINSDQENSECWNNLLKMIGVYEYLVKNNSWLAAAVLQNKIEREISNFNPINYFPKKFVSYLDSQLCGYEEIKSMYKYKDGEIWPLLEQLYVSNPTSFIERDFNTFSSILEKGNGSNLESNLNTNENFDSNEDFL
ncbi:type VI secretion system protein IglI family protein [Francisella adeliensis]|uniref:Uncharacterized protein n=1 Tax=Francisella adeliensis TaxID=2007306 RepID=A0A2Z4Y0A8_9GAMM|nr:type VI secretion system protein IglI family protein [Francisella adeliensis]AXA34581.1 hypothetical protein CDH04_09315 [Francisella adeliensis]MBK2086305.1 hypothetical protein [Francisella adeliensis]MBK2096521.1 hypothetical protein [Francisella adeliensis]QIW12826.1 hypothetical protein FZC43_09330 [Francisella adeliensis]QIW14703.1 hypothetical protein FZC44_09320 [Francisella adeliensis]